MNQNNYQVVKSIFFSFHSETIDKTNSLDFSILNIYFASNYHNTLILVNYLLSPPVTVFWDLGSVTVFLYVVRKKLTFLTLILYLSSL